MNINNFIWNFIQILQWSMTSIHSDIQQMNTTTKSKLIGPWKLHLNITLVNYKLTKEMDVVYITGPGEIWIPLKCI